MSQCSYCGRTGLFLAKKCIRCKKGACDRCRVDMDGKYLCKQCYVNIKDYYKSMVTAKLGTNCLNCGRPLDIYRMRISTPDGNTFNWTWWCGCGVDILRLFSNYDETLRHAQRAESAGRYEDAAILYESIYLFDRAKKGRKIDKHHITKHIHMDINALLNQLRESKLVSAYSCPRCSAPIKIDASTNASMLSTCPYCDTQLKITDIENFLRSILS